MTPISTGIVVIFDHAIPAPDRDSGSLRMRRLIEQWQDLGHPVVLVAVDRTEREPYASDLRGSGVVVLTDEGQTWAYLLEHTHEIAYFVLSRLDVAMRFITKIRTMFQPVPVIFDTVDLHWLRERRSEDLIGAPHKGSETTKVFEQAMMRTCDVTLVVSAYEQQLLTRDLPGVAVVEVSNVHEAHAAPAPVGRDLVTFVGGFSHGPNVTAAEWMVREVVPLLDRDAQVMFIGDGPPASLTADAPSSVTFAGWVDDLDPIMSRTRVAIAPLQAGAGVKGKVGDAWARGIPVVMTSIAAEGMGAVSGENSIVADSPAAFADAVNALRHDDALWLQLSTASQEAVEDRFGPAAARAALHLLEATLSTPPQPQRAWLRRMLRR